MALGAGSAFHGDAALTLKPYPRRAAPCRGPARMDAHAKVLARRDAARGLVAAIPRNGRRPRHWCGRRSYQGPTDLRMPLELLDLVAQFQLQPCFGFRVEILWPSPVRTAPASGGKSAPVCARPPRRSRCGNRSRTASGHHPSAPAPSTSHAARIALDQAGEPFKLVSICTFDVETGCRHCLRDRVSGCRPPRAPPPTGDTPDEAGPLSTGLAPPYCDFCSPQP